MLYQTKYGNNIRTVSGVVNMFQDDVILEVDTSTSACTINLNQIPPSNWNTIYKVYIYDISNNAAVNNITIVPAAGQTINGQPNLVITGNGGAAILRVLGTDRYGATLIGGTSLGGHIIQDEGTSLPQQPFLNFIGPGVTAYDLGGKSNVKVVGGVLSLTNADMLTLITNSQVDPGQFYQITDAIFITTYFAVQENVPVIVQGSSTNTVSLEGQGSFLNADYQLVGNYSGVPGYVANLGVWNNTMVPVVGNVVIWYNKHYVNITGVNTSTAPSSDPTNWTVIAKSTTTGYINEIDFVTYDVSANVIRSRKDLRNNYVENNFAANGYRAQTFDVFQWGNNKVAYNTVIGNSVMYCYQNQVIGGSLPQTTDNGIFGNIVQNDSYIELSNAGNRGAIRFNDLNGFSGMFFSSLNAGLCERNQILNSTCQFSTEDPNDVIQDNFVVNSNLVVQITNTLSGFIQNQIKMSYVILTSLKGLFSRNDIDRTTLNVDLLTATSVFTQNTLINSILEGTITSTIAEMRGNFKFNVIDDSLIKLDLQTADGNFENNILRQGSRFVCQTNDGNVLYNEILNLSTLQVDQNSGPIGRSIKDTGIRLMNQSSIIMKNNTAKWYNCVFDQRTEITISNDSIGDWYGCLFKTILISCTDQKGTFSNLTTDSGSISVPTINMNFNNGSCIKGGYNSIEAVLDLTDPTIYDAGTKTLFIPAECNNFAGIYQLKAAAGQQIDFIQDVSSNYLVEFYCEANTVIFNAISITPYVAYSIVANSIGLITINGRVAPSLPDSLIMKAQLSGTLNGIVEQRIYA